MLSSLQITALVSLVLLQAAGIDLVVAKKPAKVDGIVGKAFADIDRIINNAARLIKISLENDIKDTVKLERTIGVAGDFNLFELRAEELDRFFVGRVNHILEHTNLLLDRAIDAAEQKVQDLVRGRSTLPQVEITQAIMHRLVWDTEDFASTLVFKAKPEFFKINRKAHKEARRVHDEALRNGKNRAEAQRKFEQALRRGADESVALVNKNGNKIRDEIKRVTKILRGHSLVLIAAGHAAQYL